MRCSVTNPAQLDPPALLLLLPTLNTQAHLKPITVNSSSSRHKLLLRPPGNPGPTVAWFDFFAEHSPCTVLCCPTCCLTSLLLIPAPA